MAHYAFLDKNSIVTEVIVGVNETELIEGLDPETWYGNFRGQKCVRTSYNSKVRFNYAGIGMSYNQEADAFVPIRPECNHKELFLNDKFQWTCQGCDLESKKLFNEAQTK